MKRIPRPSKHSTTALAIYKLLSREDGVLINADDEYLSELAVRLAVRLMKRGYINRNGVARPELKDEAHD